MSTATQRRPTERIMVKGAQSTAGIAQTLTVVLRRDGEAILQAVGASTVNQAVKGIAAAGQMLIKENKDVLTMITFEDAPSRDNPKETITRMDFHVRVQERP